MSTPGTWTVQTRSHLLLIGLVVWLGILIWPNIPAILVALLAVWGYQRAVLDRLLERIPRSTSPPRRRPGSPVARRRFATTLDVDLRLDTPATALHTGERRLAAGGRRSATPARSSPPVRRPRELLGMPRLADVNTLRGLDDALALREQ
jgi:hypothetical protein